MSWFINPLLIRFVLPLRRPVQNWMLAHGLGKYAAEYGMFNLHIPCIVLCLSAGAVIGFTHHRQWIGLVLLFGVCFILAPDLFEFVAIGSLSPLKGFQPTITLISLCYQITAVFPAAFTGAWIASKLASRRYKLQLSAAGLCPVCEYNLAGNVSGRCPECGHSVQLTTTG
ncbi:MAG: hypothetical protein HZA51_02630 [Planctomycetes bacterium]|nr:hypothetical protein [Planctomycetota bacterium]